MFPVGMIVADMQALAAHFALGQVLEQQTGSEAAAAAAIRAGTVAHGDLTEAGDLLGLGEIQLRRGAQPRAFQRHDALKALAGRRHVEGDGQEALAEQAEERRRVAQLGEPIGVILRIAAHGAGLVVGDEQRDHALLGARPAW